MSLILTSIATVTLTAASVQDLKSHKVKHLTWMPLLAAGILFLLLDLYGDLGSLPLNWFAGRVINIVISLAAGLSMIYLLRKFYGMGGADLMALLCLTIAYATVPYFMLVVVGVGIAGIALTWMLPGFRNKKIPWIPYIFAGYLSALLFLGGI
jgi:hypothetical protein